MAHTVLAIVPHPDDAEFYAGGTLAKFAKEGNKVVIVVTTDGSKGSFEKNYKELIDLRKSEAHNAGRRLGAEEVILLGFVDFELDRLPQWELREIYVRLIREYRPDILLTEDYLYAEELHPDHRVVARMAAEAVTFASLPLLYPKHIQEGLTAHFTPEKYFYTEDLGAANKIIDITDTFDNKMAALSEHKSQMIFLVEDIFRQANVAGLDLKSIMGDTLEDPNTAIRLAMQMQAVKVGQQGNVPMGEAFRVIRFHPLIEGLLTSSMNK